MSLDNFAGYEVHRFDLPHPRLLNLGPGVVAGGPLAEAQIADFPPGDAVEIEPRPAVGDLSARSRGKAAVAHSQQNARQPGSVLLAPQSIHRFADERTAGIQLRPIRKSGGD